MEDTMHRVDEITRTTNGMAAVAEARTVMAAFERLGFEVVEVAVEGQWILKGNIINLERTIVGSPSTKNKIELASGVHIAAGATAKVHVTGEREMPPVFEAIAAYEDTVRPRMSIELAEDCVAEITEPVDDDEV
jgi:hypothetical protein